MIPSNRWLVLGFLFFAASMLAANERAVQLVIIPPSDNPIPQAEDILRNSYQQELTNAGFQIVPANRQSRVAVVITYRTLGRTMFYDIAVRDNESGEQLYRASHEKEITARINIELRGNIRTMIPYLHQAFAPRPAEELPDTSVLLPDSVPETGIETDTDTEPESAPRPPTPESPAARQDRPDPAQQPAVPHRTETTETPGTKEPDSEILGNLSVSIGGGIFIPVGDIGNYSDFGYTATLFAGYNIGRGAVHFTPGIALGVTGFNAAGAANNADITLLPIGIGFKVSSSQEPQFTPVWYLHGGASMMWINTIDKGTLFTTVPYVSSGMGLRASIIGIAGLEFRVDFSIYLDPELPVLGISPTIALSF